LKCGLTFAVDPRCRGIVCGEDARSALDVRAWVQYLGDGIAQCREVAAVHLHQPQIDGVAQSDIALGQINGVGQGVRVRLCPHQSIDMQRKRVAAAFHRHNGFQRDRRHVQGAGEQCGRDHRSTHTGRATP
jgi:hypothetical protein